MASTNKSLAARVAVGLGALALAALTTVGGAVPASAVGPNVEIGRAGSITIHKYAEPAAATHLANDGLAIGAGDLGALTPLAGVGFKAELVPGTDLTTAAGWELPAELAAADDDAAVSAAQQRIQEAGTTLTRTGTTGALDSTSPGQLLFGDLQLGVYLVTETSSGDNQIAIKSAPFLVSVPMAHPTSADWIYDVHVYPKNSLAAISKVVDDAGAFGLGDEVSWTITVRVPEVAAGDVLGGLVITDALDPRLGYVSATVAATAATSTAGDRVAIPLTAGQHFTVAEQRAFSVTFDPAGLDLLAAADGVELTVEIVTTIDRLEGDFDAQTADGIIHNAATVEFAGGARFTVKTPTPTSWGTLTIRKHDAAAQDVALEGATFRVYRSAADAAEGRNPIAVNAALPRQVDFTSQDNGIAFVPGLKAGTYWIVETVAPLGYAADPRPLEVVVQAGDLTQLSVELQVGNEKIAAYALPVTGGSGQAAFMIGGAGLLITAVGFALVRRRKARADA